MKNFIVSAIFGFIALLVVNLTGDFTGVFLTVSKLSIGVAGILGIPGVMLMILLKLIL